MDGTTLNVAAPVFQPAASKNSNVPTARQPSPLQMPPSVSGPATPLHDRNAPSSQPFQPTMLSQIQNQMFQAGGVPCGMVHMNASSRPFVPGVAAPGIFKPQTPTAPFQSGSPSALNPSRSPLPGHRLGHGIHPGSVQLTGLPAFLATPPTMANIPHSPAFAAPPSPLSPHASGPASPFMMPQGQANLGVPHPGGIINPNMKLRKGKAPQPVTPLKTTGHNSTPSISMNPAAFAASLTALKAKKKVIVSVPNERPLPEDELILAQPESEPEDEAGADTTDASRTDAAKRRRARASALIRHKWVLRQPWDLDRHNLVPCTQMPDDSIVTCEIHPEPWPHSLGLPDTIEIYLPGMSAWDEYREMRLEEQQMEAEAAKQNALFRLVRPKPLLPSELAAFNAERGRSFSISSPADPSMVSFKLNRFLQSQQLFRDVQNQPIADDKPTSLDDEAVPFSRFQSDLTNRLREAFARRRGESIDLNLHATPKHGRTMSLGLPSAGGPFGPEVFSALDMIRANSDEGPSQTPSEVQYLPDKPLSDTDALTARTEPFLARIVEDEAEEQAQSEASGDAHDNAKASGSGSWKDLGRGFGYEPEPTNDGAAGRGPSQKHARQTSRISVSTSRRGGENSDEGLSVDEDVEIRTNPSEDADASDFEEEFDEYGPEHWQARRHSVHLSAFGDAHDRDGYQDLSDEDSLRDSLTPSDEQFSNPSDEEAAREERIMRRQQRAAERAARRERKRQRGEANTDNTLPSSSIGEAGIHAHSRSDQEQEQRRYSHYDEIISNPSDEVQSDLDDAKTFGHPERSRRAEDGPRLSQDFRFPPPKPVAPNTTQARQSNAAEGNGVRTAGTLGRASGISLLNPDAKEFKFGGVAATRAVSAPVSNVKDTQEETSGHFRLPSIKTSSFGSSALGDVPANAPHLNVGAPSFTPGAFTFEAPVRFPVTAQTASSKGAASRVGGEVDNNDVESREMQGREKRTRYGPIDYNSEDERYEPSNTSPPRPKASAASIEGPLRGFSSLARQGPPPFLPPGYDRQQRAVSHESRFTAEAPSFVPTWAKGAIQLGGSTSFKRPSLPDWGQKAQDGIEHQVVPSIRDLAFFTKETGSKAIPIRRPSENNEAEAVSRKRELSSGQSSASLEQSSAEGAVASSAISPQDHAAHALVLDGGQTSTETLMASARWNGSMRPGSPWFAERAQPMHIPAGPNSYQSSNASLASYAGAGPSVRWGDRRTPSSLGRSSFDRRSRPADRGDYSHRGVRGNDGHDDDDEEESLTDFIEEIADRVDKALEGWAGKILDEVTIMGQVRPRGSVTTADLSLDQDKIVQEISRRMEEALDTHVATTFTAHARKSTDASDETQTTIRPVRHRNSSADEKMAGSSPVDAPGEWDFDYVQDILDVKLGEFRKQIESTMAQVVEKLDARDELSASSGMRLSENKNANGSGVPSDFVEGLTVSLVRQLESLFDSHTSSAKEVQSASEERLQRAVQEKLDENLFLLSEKGAANRSNIQQMLESELHVLERSISEVGTTVKEHLQSALNECLPPLLEGKGTSDATLADRLTNKLGQALGPLLSEERRCLLEDSQRSRDILLEALPSSSQIAQSTAKLVEPLVESLKSDPIDSDALVQRLAEVIGKQSIEHMVDLNPVLALLEPLISKQEDAKSFSKKILQRQEDTERTLSELPGAINAKTEIFLSSAFDTSEKQGLILQKIDEIKSELERKVSTFTDASQVDSESLHKALEGLSRDKELNRKTAEKTLSELAGVYQVLNSSYEALSRLEAQHSSSEEAHRELTARLEKQAQASANLAREFNEAEARAARAEAGKVEIASKLSSSDKESAMLREQLAQMANELAAAKAERAQERDASAKALAEAMARADRAEAANVEMQDRMGRLVEQANTAEREAYDSAKSVLERASKAEGQLVALEKRIAEQDNKIANLQHVSATQKQKAAQSHQKLAEGEKRVKELEAKARELSEATVRLGILEAKAVELEETKRHLQESEDREAHVRAEMRQYDERFNEMERDLVQIKENFVELSTHEKTKTQLAESQAMVEQLKAQLEAQQAREAADGWGSVDKPPTGAWASMHAPKVRIEDESDLSAELCLRSVSFASTTGSSRKEVEVDEGGWWS